ncbi:MAG TPA: heavy metal-binding domain-containing protein [Lacunisphaera sp.]|jgi:uncharacterized protein YbjQ (UPF0145 family)
MILTTTPTVEGKIVSRYIDVVGTEVIFGAMFLKDWIAQGADDSGGRVNTYEKVFEDARKEAFREIRIKADQIGADAIINLRVSYQVLGEKNGMMMVAVTGSAVALALTKEDREALRQADKLAAAEDAADYMVDFGDRVRGPFSKTQMRAMLSSGRLLPSAVTVDEDGIRGDSVAEVLQ